MSNLFEANGPYHRKSTQNTENMTEMDVSGFLRMTVAMWVQVIVSLKHFIKLETLQSSASERPRYMPKAAAIHYFSVCHSGQSRSRSAKKRRLQRLPPHLPFCQYEGSSSSRWRTGTQKPKSRSRRFCVNPFAS